MATKADLDAALDAVVSEIQALGTDLDKTLADLAAKIAAGADVSAEVDKANAIASSLKDIDSKIAAADPGA